MKVGFSCGPGWHRVLRCSGLCAGVLVLGEWSLAYMPDESRGLFPLVWFPYEWACLLMLVLVCLFLWWCSFLSCVIRLRITPLVLFALFPLVLSHLCYSLADNSRLLVWCLDVCVLWLCFSLSLLCGRFMRSALGCFPNLVSLCVPFPLSLFCHSWVLCSLGGCFNCGVRVFV